MWQTIGAVAVPILGVIAGLLRGGQNGQLAQRIKHYAKLLEMVESVPRAKVALSSIIGDQAEEIQRRETARLAKKINKANLAVAIFITVIAMLGLYGLTTWSITVWGSPVAWIAICASVLIGLSLLLLTAAGFTTIYAPRKDTTGK